MRRSFSPAVVVPLLVLVGCGGRAADIAYGGQSEGTPTVTAENVYEFERAFWRMAPDDPARVTSRDALIAYRSQRSSEILERGDYAEIVGHLADLTTLLAPADIEAGRVPSELAPLARWIIENGARRGDEGRVMGALVLLGAIEGSEAHRSERDRIAEWGQSARARISNPIERYGELIQVWEQYEELAPAPEVLESLARLYVEQRNALANTLGPEQQGGRPVLSFRDLQLAPHLMRRAPLDVAAVYLRHGDLDHAIEHVRRMGGRGEMQNELVGILERARQDDDAGAHALDELARGFARARPSVTAAICRLGARRFPQDARFALCLARVAVEQSEPGRATGWYAEAVRLAPTDRATYDEALGRLSQMIEEGAMSSDIGQSRAIARHALEILDERLRRFPDDEPALTRDALLLVIGRTEMMHGNVSEARERLAASLAVTESAEAHEQLGLLFERMGDGREAARHYRRALDLVDGSVVEETARRAQLLEHLGDAFRQSGEEQNAERMYRQALELWNGLTSMVSGPRSAFIHVRRGVLASRIGALQEAEQAFVTAMEALPTWREPYAAILSHLVIAEPNVELAQRVLRRAQYQLSLEPEWKVYFALWVQAIAARAGIEPDGDVAAVFADIAEGSAWHARLAAFGRGQLSYEELLEAASNRGERAEALFYQGARLLGEGDVEGARALFREVLETEMISFYEYIMAQELLRVLPASNEPARVGAASR